MKRDGVYFVAKCLNFQQVKMEHLRLGATSQDIAFPLWKWEMINMDFVNSCDPKTRMIIFGLFLIGWPIIREIIMWSYTFKK